jgi:4-amino-4-deoxy-L-arabinose transferase-like glycosyltransferase
MLSSLNKKILILLIISIGILLRFYNFNFEDLWYDEIISFSAANPNFLFFETKNFHDQIETTSPIYNLILKVYFKFLGYSIFNGRLLSVIFSILSIFSIIYLDKQLNKKNNAYIFSSFLISTNIFLIAYSQELRNYSLLFFATSLTLIFFIKLLEDEKNFKLLLIFLIVFLFNILLHPFGLLMFFSLSFYLLLELIIKKKFPLLIFALFLVVSIISCLFYYKLFSMTTNSGADYYWWMKNPSLSFYTNFHFSNYFGSRLVGGIFLITLIYLIVKNFKKIFEINFYTLFVIIIIFSYLIPILFGYLFKPMLLPRYTMFNLVPIILLLSSLTFNNETKKIKYLIILVLTLFTTGNLLTEQSVKQFYQNRIASKPEYSKAINFIDTSTTKNYALKIVNMKNDEATSKAIENYIKYLNKDLNLIKLKDLKLKDHKFWFFCPLDINSGCELPNFIKKKTVILEEKQFNSIVLTLVKVDI